MGSPWLGMGRDFGKMEPRAPGRVLDASGASGRPYKKVEKESKNSREKVKKKIEKQVLENLKILTEWTRMDPYGAVWTRMVHTAPYGCVPVHSVRIPRFSEISEGSR